MKIHTELMKCVVCNFRTIRFNEALSQHLLRDCDRRYPVGPSDRRSNSCHRAEIHPQLRFGNLTKPPVQRGITMILLLERQTGGRCRQ